MDSGTEQTATSGGVGPGVQDVKDIKDFVHTSPGTLAGRYLRRFWRRELDALRDGHPLKQWAGFIPLSTSGL